MRLLIIFIAIFCVSTLFAQGIKISGLPTYNSYTKHGVIPVVVGNTTYGLDLSKIGKVDSVYVSNNTLNVLSNGTLRNYAIASNGVDSLSHTGAISSLPSVSYNPNTKCVPCLIDSLFYQAQPATATLTGGQTLELMAGGTALNYGLSWTASRQFSSKTISTVTINGVSQFFSQPAQSGTVSGTQSVAVPRNTTTTYQNIVTTSDGKTGIATATFSFLPKRYFGWVNSSSPSDGNLTALTGELSSAMPKTWVQSATSGSQYLVYAYPATEGALTDFVINGISAIHSMTLTVRSLTNALGYTQSYNIYVSVNPLTASGTTSIVAY